MEKSFKSFLHILRKKGLCIFIGQSVVAFLKDRQPVPPSAIIELNMFRAGLQSNTPSKMFKSSSNQALNRRKMANEIFFGSLGYNFLVTTKAKVSSEDVDKNGIEDMKEVY